MRLLLLGSGDFGLPTFQLLAQHHDIAAVISQPDRPAGRKRTLTATPIAAWAQQQSFPVYKEQNVNTPAFLETVRHANVDASVVIAFGQKLSPGLLEAMGDLTINLHASLLPRYRGAGPINWAMIRGEPTTGVAVIALAEKMDAGDVYANASLAIDPYETAGELHDRLANLGPEVVERVLNDFARGTLNPKPQDHAQATLAPKLKKADGTVDFDQPADKVRARIHGLTPWPGCRVQWSSPSTGTSHVLAIRRVKDDLSAAHTLAKLSGVPGGGVLGDLRVACGVGAVTLLEVQPPGKSAMSFDAFLQGHAFRAGDSLSAI